MDVMVFQRLKETFLETLRGVQEFPIQLIFRYESLEDNTRDFRIRIVTGSGLSLLEVSDYPWAGKFLFAGLLRTATAALGDRLLGFSVDLSAPGAGVHFSGF